MPAKPYTTPVKQLQRAVGGGLNLQTVLVLSIGSEIVVQPSGEAMNVQGVSFLRVYNTSGSTATPSAVVGSTLFPLRDQAGVAITVVTAVSQLVDVRGAEHVSFNQAVSISLVV